MAIYWEKIGLKVKRLPVDRAVFVADLRARLYVGVTLAYAGPVIALEPWELLIRFVHTRASVQVLLEHPALDAFVDR